MSLGPSQSHFVFSAGAPGEGSNTALVKDEAADDSQGGPKKQQSYRGVTWDKVKQVLSTLVVL